MSFAPNLLNRYTQVLVVSILLLLSAGALVTSTGSGLSVPDWPLSYGQYFPPMIGGILYEHGHRLVAGFVALLTVAQCFLYWRYEERRWVKYLSAVAVLLVLAQATLGGLTVLLRLPKAISIAHACLAQLFLCLNVVLMIVTSQRWSRVYPAKLGNKLPWAVSFFSVMFFFQLMAGATVRHFHAGLAVPDFPRMFGSWVPVFSSFDVTIHLLHRFGAYLITLYGIILCTVIFRRYSQCLGLVSWSGALVALISFQVMLGASVIWTKRPVFLTMSHLVVGAACFACSVALTVEVWRTKWVSES